MYLWTATVLKLCVDSQIPKSKHTDTQVYNMFGHSPVYFTHLHRISQECSVILGKEWTFSAFNYKYKKQKSRNRPGVAQRVPGGLGSQISMTFDTRR